MLPARALLLALLGSLGLPAPGLLHHLGGGGVERVPESRWSSGGHHHGPKHHEARRRILVVIPVGPSNMDVFFANVRAFPPRCCHFELFPYSVAAQRIWHSERITERLSKLPHGSVNVSIFGTHEGRKHELVAEAVRTAGSRILEYNWVMLVDDDIVFTQMDLKRFWGLAEASNAQIVGPSMKFSRYWAGFMQPHGSSRNCSNSLYRYTNFVEVQAPMFRPSALRIVVSELMFPLIRNSSLSDWGMDNTWCSLVSQKVKTPMRRTCAIVDGEYAMHADTRSGELLIEQPKLTGNSTLNVKDRPKPVGDIQIALFRQLFPQHFVEQTDVQEFQCCSRASCGNDQAGDLY